MFVLNSSIEVYMETIHKNGSTYLCTQENKGELKSHNWVGRTYINGKQGDFFRNHQFRRGYTNIREMV